MATTYGASLAPARSEPPPHHSLMGGGRCTPGAGSRMRRLPDPTARAGSLCTPRSNVCQVLSEV